MVIMNNIFKIICTHFIGASAAPFTLHDNVSSLNLTRKILKSVFRNYNALKKVLNTKIKKGQPVLAFRGTSGIGDMLRLAAVIAAIKKENPDLIFDIYVGNISKGEFAFAALQKRYLLQENLLYLTYRQYDAIINISDREPFILINKTPLTDKMQKVADENKYLESIDTTKRAEKGLVCGEVISLTRGYDNKKQPLYCPIQLEPQNFVEGKYITLHYGWDNDVKIKNHNKIWPFEYYQNFVKLFKKQYPDIQVVQLGLKRMPYIEGCIDLRSKTTMAQASSVLKNSLLHIDCDCGFVHIAYNLGVKSLVLFGPSNADYVGYKQNINIVSPFCNNCWDLAETWAEICPKGYKTNKCMWAITPDMVLEKVKTVLGYKHE